MQLEFWGTEEYSSTIYNSWPVIPRKGDIIWGDNTDYRVIEVCWNPGLTPIIRVMCEPLRDEKEIDRI